VKNFPNLGYAFFTCLLMVHLASRYINHGEIQVSNSYFELNREKIRETLLYIAARVKNPTLHTVFKIMYFADKLHLSNYGRFITGDTYYAMEYGPVPSAAYDMTKDAEFHALNGIKITGYHLKPLRKANIGVRPSDCAIWAHDFRATHRCQP
jgi:hypothetical protein